MSKTSEILNKIGLSENEIKAYEAVVAFSYRTAGQISYYTKVSLVDVISACDSLITKNYLKKKSGKTDESAIYIPLAPKIVISSRVSENLSKQLAGLSKNISEIWDETQTVIDKDMGKLIESVEKAISNLSSDISSISTSHQDEINDLNSEFFSSVSNITNDATTTFEDEIQTPLSELATKLTELSKSIENICDESIKNIEDANESHNNQLTEAGGELKEELENFVESVSLFTSGRISGVSQQIENVSNETDTRVQSLTPELVSKVEKAITREKNLLVEMDKAFPKNLLGSYNLANENIIAESNNVEKSLGNAINSIKEVQQKSVKAAVSSGKKIIQSIDEKQNSKVSSLQEGLLSAISTIQEDAVSNLGNVLSNTSTQLNQTKEQMVSQIQNQESNLNSDLKNLQQSLMNALGDRFDLVKERLSEFVGNLKGQSEGNIDKIVNNVNDLKEFLVNFLSDIKSEFSDYLGGLQDEVKISLSEIVNNTTENLNSAVVSRKEDLTTAQNDIGNKIIGFKDDFNKFLEKTGKDIGSKLEDDHESFNSQIQKNIDEFQDSTQSLKKQQEDQINAINVEVKLLNEEAEKIKNGIQDGLSSKLKDHRDTQVEKITTNTNSLVDKFSREFTRFNEKLDRELKGFYDEFQNKSSGLREDVPEKIEGVFLDQVDRLDNFKRDFQRIMGHANKMLTDFVGAFSSDGKKIDKKMIPELFGDVTRAQADFLMFEDQMNGHFGNTIDDTEDIKDELLTEISKTIQDELTELENLVQAQGKQATDLSDEFIKSIKSHSDDFVDGIEIGVDEPISEIESSISNDLLELFTLPLNAVLTKVQVVATGSEDSETENRLVLTQNQILEKIQSSVNSLNIALKDSFSTTISGLGESLSGTKSEAENMISGLNSQIDTIFDDQNETIESFNSDLQTSLNNVQSSINESLSGNIAKTIKQMGSTVESKSKELQESVTSGNTNLKKLTATALNEVDQSLASFQSEFDTILNDTGKDVDNTIQKATETQGANVEKTINEVTTTTTQALESITEAKTSLSDNVSKVLAKTENDVKELVNSFKSSIEASRGKLQGDIESNFANSGKFIEDLDKISVTFGVQTKTYLDSLITSRKQINDELKLYLEEYQKSRLDHTSNMNENFSNVITDITNTSSEFIIEIFDQVYTQIQMLQIEIDEYVKTSKDVIQDLVTNSIEGVRTANLTASNTVSKALSEEKSNSPIKFTEMASIITGLSGEQDSTIQKSKSEFQSKVETVISQKGDEWKTKMDKEYSKEIAKISKLPTDLTTKLQDQTSSGKQAVTDAISKIPLMIESTLDATAKSMKLLSEISEGSLSLEPSIPELSYFDASKEAILANLNGVISRSKSSLTIVCPSISWIDPDLIENFKRVSVKIITDIENHNADDEVIMNLFKEKEINLDLRKLDRNRYRGGINMIMATRDKEEIILSKLPTDPSPYAFVSQDEVYIEKFSELFSPFHTMPRA